MALTAGTRVGAYEITARIGAGGMGEVYRARDTRLKREVAIKIVPEPFAADSDRVARFQREAEILASLNHPNIGGIHGLEESGGVKALVLELVEGETLADWIARGPIPIDQALPIARQIAEALEAAHERGIIHRDLKPANIKITSDGVVKVLDFGLAKLAEQPTSTSNPPVLLTSPTMTSPALMTRAGIVLGTAAYMSPEQARGLPVDKRTDIWSFGCVLYEMVTSRVAFRRDTVTDTLAAIIEHDPDWTMLPPATPVTVARLLRRCLEKNAKRRLRDIGDAYVDLEGTASFQSSAGTATPARARSAQLAVVLVVVLGVVTVVVLRSLQLANIARFQAHPMTRLTWDAGYTTEPSISADGRLIAYASDRAADGNMDIWVQQVVGGPAIRLTLDPANDSEPDVSPDGSMIAFRSERQPAGIYVVPALGGDARLIAQDGRAPQFSPDGRSVAFWTGGWLTPRVQVGVRHTYVVPAEGGEPVEIQKELASVGDPVWSPDGRALLVFGRRRTSGSDLQTDWWRIPLDTKIPMRTGAYKRLEASGIDISGSDDPPFPSSWTTDGVFFSGRLAGSDSRSIWMLPLDPAEGDTSGAPVQVTSGTSWDVRPSIARDGRLVFAAVSVRTVLLGLPLDANAGKVTGMPYAVRVDTAPTGRASVSADGRVLAFYSSSLTTSELWTRDLASGRERQLAVTARVALNPVLSPDARWVAYSVPQALDGTGGGGGSAYVIAATGGVARKVCDDCFLYSWSPDDQHVFIAPGERKSLELLELRSGKRTRLVSSAHLLDRALLSPDGKWLNFSMDGHGIVVVPFHPDRPATEDEWQILPVHQSAERAAGWSPDGRLLYVLLERDGFRCLYAVQVDLASGAFRGDPFPVHHFHDAHLRTGSTGFGSAVVQGLFLSNHQVLSGNIWMTALQRNK